jgi:hypothetical protein
VQGLADCNKRLQQRLRDASDAADVLLRDVAELTKKELHPYDPADAQKRQVTSIAAGD